MTDCRLLQPCSRERSVYEIQTKRITPDGSDPSRFRGRASAGNANRETDCQASSVWTTMSSCPLLNAYQKATSLPKGIAFRNDITMVPTMLLQDPLEYGGLLARNRALSKHPSLSEPLQCGSPFHAPAALIFKSTALSNTATVQWAAKPVISCG